MERSSPQNLVFRTKEGGWDWITVTYMDGWVTGVNDGKHIPRPPNTC